MEYWQENTTEILATYLPTSLKTYCKIELALAVNKFAYVEKWLSNDHINHKLSNHLWKTQTQTAHYAQITWLTHGTPTIYMLKPTHQRSPHRVTQQSNPPNYTHFNPINTLDFYTLTIIWSHHSEPQDNRAPEWILQCTCTLTPCTCLGWLQPDIQCILGTPDDSHSLPPHQPQYNLLNSPIAMIDSQLMQPKKKQDKYLPLIQTLRIVSW